MGMPHFCLQHIPLNRKPFWTDFVRCGNLALRSMRTVQFPSKTVMERVMGIGPTQSAWKADILPLNYTRTNAEMQSQKITSTFQCLSILPYRTIDVKKNERLSQFLYLLTPSKTAIALIPLHCPITYPTQHYKHMQSARFRTIWQFNS